MAEPDIERLRESGALTAEQIAQAINERPAIPAAVREREGLPGGGEAARGRLRRRHGQGVAGVRVPARGGDPLPAFLDPQTGEPDVIEVTRQCWNHLFKHTVKRRTKEEKLERALCWPYAVKLLEKTTTYQGFSRERDRGDKRYDAFEIIGYVLNVIEDGAERAATLRSAYALCRQVLAVSAQVTLAGRGKSRAAYLFQGILSNRRSQPVVVEWFAVHLQPGRQLSLTEPGFGEGLANTGQPSILAGLAPDDDVWGGNHVTCQSQRVRASSSQRGSTTRLWPFVHFAQHSYDRAIADYGEAVRPGRWRA